MSAPRHLLKHLNLFIDGKGYAGQVEDINLPKLTLKTEEFRGGGMLAPVELTMGMEKLETDVSLICYSSDALLLFGVTEGKQVNCTVRGFLESFDGTTTTLAIHLRGKVKEIDRGTWKPADKSTLKLALALSYYKEVHNATVIHEIDVENMIFQQNGIDLLAPARNALGL
ncbi:phage major tail tube protein [Xylella fastidiosa]|uniref:Phage-related contractile tail tube protein n=1 Tax=Xylella fastidiosa (strain 9a5c) TaxID=160492 RepID=Q9P9Q4_XYLFA|nr:phage major tail tube protein [Xylella fastidiosa]AAF83538.1 phage-related contractile tail tube protein [Xylella fastidiosa 9a5c]AAF85282.1 phage-related protein [Xylella fastidiosa 9a5c]ALQ94305.1 major tail tube protein [Xylella fastidiosa]ALQ95533.1 major tail tube protein [Xylella fastidiosa]ALR01612.1 major tail tube protein [Xylella fastidiosa]